jgi:hypothetical protein
LSTSIKQFKNKPDDREQKEYSVDIQHRVEFYFRIFLNLGIFAIFSSPFVVYFAVLYPYTVPKALWIQSINWIVLLVYIIGIILNKNLYQIYKPKLNFIFYLYLVYILLYFISSVFGENFTRSFWSDFQRMTGLYWHIHTLIIFFLLSGILNKPKHFYILMTFVFFSGIVLSIFYIFEFYSIFAFNMPGYSDSNRVVFTFGNPGFAGLYFMLVYLIGIGMFRYNFYRLFSELNFLNSFTEKYKFLLYFTYMSIGSFLLIYSVFISASRSAFIGAMSGTIMFLILLVVKNNKIFNYRNLFFGLIATILIPVLFTIILFLTDIGALLFSRFEVLLTSNSSVDIGLSTRLANLNVVYNAFLDKPVFGNGMFHFASAYNKFSIPSQVTSWEMDNAHNILTNILVTGGLSVFLIYIYMMWNVLFYSIKSSEYNFKSSEFDMSALNFIVIIFFTGYFFHHMFWFDIQESFVLFVLMLTVVNFSLKSPKFIASKVSKIAIISKDFFYLIFKNNQRIFVTIIIIIIPLIFINIELKILRATSQIWDYGAFKIESNYKTPEELDTALSEKYILLENAMDIFPPLANDARVYIINDAVHSVSKLPDPIRTNFFEFATKHSISAVESQPEYWKTYARAGILYFERAKIEQSDLKYEYKNKSVEYLNKSIEIGPSRIDLYRSLIVVFLWFDETDNAKLILEKYKDFLNSRNSELDHNYYVFKSTIDFHRCSNSSDDYDIIKNCIYGMN